MHKHHTLFLAVMMAIPCIALAADPVPVPQNDTPLKGAYQQLPQSDVYDLISKSETTFSAWYYGRDRQEQVPNSDRGDIKVNAINLGLNFKSGYAWDKVGFDVAAHTAQKIGETRGQSEILLHDPNVNKDESYSVISQGAIKFRQNANGEGLSTRIGYTPISIGTLGTSGGLQSHSYRGAEVKYKTGDLEIGYGWADQFRNEWDNRFRDITNSWEQGRLTGSTAKKIDYINSLGLRYALKDGFIDIGIGEGKNSRRNAQIAVSNGWDLGGGDKLTATGYLYTAKDIRQPTDTVEPKAQYHASGSVNYVTGGLSLMGGLGHTSAPVAGNNGAANEANFRLTGWANSDNRNFIQTWGQDDDFVWDGMTVFKVGLNYDFAKVGVPGLSAGISGNYATGAKYQVAGVNKTTAVSEVDFSVGYSVQSGVLKGLSVGVYPAWLHTGDFCLDGGAKCNRNDVKVIASYSKTF